MSASPSSTTTSIHIHPPTLPQYNGRDSDTNNSSRFYHALNNQMDPTAAIPSAPQSLARSKSAGSFSNTMSSPRRLSSGSACEVCRRRKTKCDGGHPCGFCSANRIECVHRATRRKKSSLAMSIGHSEIVYRQGAANHNNNAIGTPRPSLLKNYSLGQYYAKPKTNNLSKQTSCPSLIVSAAIAAAATAAGGAASVTTEAVSPTHWSPSPPLPPPPHHDPISRGGERDQEGASYRRDDLYRSSNEEIPSMMDQLSCRTFSAFVDHRANYPIYPLSSPSPCARESQYASSSLSNTSTPSPILPLKLHPNQQHQQHQQQQQHLASNDP